MSERKSKVSVRKAPKTRGRKAPPAVVQCACEKAWAARRAADPCGLVEYRGDMVCWRIANKGQCGACDWFECLTTECECECWWCGEAMIRNICGGGCNKHYAECECAPAPPSKFGRLPPMLPRSRANVAPPRDPVAHGVYFILCDTTQQVKIGMTSSLRARLKNLSTASPYPIRVVAWIRCANEDEKRATERDIHQRFVAHKGRNEWFQFAPDIAAFVASVGE